ncbi:hypothetical protein V6Z11_D08G103300 [Gossypium hirsutum]
MNYIRNRGGNPYSNTYNLGWKDHSNLRWAGNQGGGNSFNPVKQNFAYQPPYLYKPQERDNLSDHTICGQRLDQIKEEMQSMRIKMKQVQSNQLMSMMREIKRKIGTEIPCNTENNPRRERKEHVKAI